MTYPDYIACVDYNNENKYICKMMRENNLFDVMHHLENFLWDNAYEIYSITLICKTKKRTKKIPIYKPTIILKDFPINGTHRFHWKLRHRNDNEIEWNECQWIPTDDDKGYIRFMDGSTIGLSNE